MLLKLIVLSLLLVVGPVFGIELVVVRHGETIWNLQRRIQGLTDIELNETGIEQAKSAGEALKGEVFSAIYSSDLKRAIKTGELIREMLDFAPAHEICIDTRIREKAFGDFEGRQFDEEFIKHAVLNDTLEHVRGAESRENLRTRLVSFLTDLAGKFSKDDKVLIVTHGGVVRALKREAGEEEYREVPNGSITRFRVTPQGRLERFLLAQELPQEFPLG